MTPLTNLTYPGVTGKAKEDGVMWKVLYVIQKLSISLLGKIQEGQMSYPCTEVGFQRGEHGQKPSHRHTCSQEGNGLHNGVRSLLQF